MGRLTGIDIQIPNRSETNLSDNKYFAELFSQLGNFRVKDYIETSFSDSLSPRTRLIPSPISNPKISFITDEANDTEVWRAGELVFGFNLSGEKMTNKGHPESLMERLTDQSGEYTKISIQNNTYFVLTIKQLLDRFNKKLVELNHSGMNLGPKLISKLEYLHFRDKLAKKCNMYKYPTGEEWPFIIPATREEYLKEIDNDTKNRNPKFELVFSKYHSKPVIQFDIKTNLTKDEVFSLLPKPYGISFEGLENFIRTVFVRVDWDNTLLRFDLGFKSKNKDFGYWLIKEGGRYR